MLRFVSRFIGLWLLAAALVVAVVDGAKSIAASSLVLTRMAETWATIAALGQAPGAGAAAAPLHWPLDVVLGWLNAAPSAAVFALLGFVFLAIGRKRRVHEFGREFAT